MDQLQKLWDLFTFVRITFRSAAVTLVLIGLGVVQAYNGFLGDSPWMRYGYPVVCLLMTIPCGFLTWCSYQVAVHHWRIGESAADFESDETLQ